MASLGLDLGDDDMLNDGNDVRARIATRDRAAKSSLCRAQWWRSARNPHRCQGHARRRTHAHRRPSACVVPSAPHRARRGGTVRTRGDRCTHGRPHHDGFWRRTSTRPTAPSAAGASCTIVRGRCRPPGQQAGCTPCAGTWPRLYFVKNVLLICVFTEQTLFEVFFKKAPLL